MSIVSWLAVGGFLVSVGVVLAGGVAWRLTRPLTDVIETQAHIIRELRQALDETREPMRETSRALELSNMILEKVVEQLEDSNDVR